MKKKILITDSLFINKEHEEKLKSNGFDIERIDKPRMNEDELCLAIQGKHGYILGGIEEVTSKVIAAADKLEAIAFTGSEYEGYIPAYKEATRKGIAISAASGASAQSVAEYTFALIFATLRNLPALTINGGRDFYISRELANLKLGVVGMGHIGVKVASMGLALGMNVLACKRRKPTQRLKKNVQYVSLEELLRSSDIVTLHVDKSYGTGVIGLKELEIIAMRKDAILINTSFSDAVDTNALYTLLLNKKLKAAFDGPPKEDFSAISREYFITSNAPTGFNTREANNRISDRAATSLINLIKNGTDADLVNPEYVKFRQIATKILP